MSRVKLPSGPIKPQNKLIRPSKPVVKRMPKPILPQLDGWGSEGQGVKG